MALIDNSPQCIITGCLLHDQDHDRWVNGDLYQLGDVYIYFANRDSERTNIDWSFAEPQGESRIIRLNPRAQYRLNELRGVIIVRANQAVLNHAAWLYVYGKAAPLPFTIQPWPPGASMLQVAVAPNAAAGPYPTAMRPATAEEVAAMQQRFAPPVAAQPAASGVDALWVEKAMALAERMRFMRSWGEPGYDREAARDALRAHLSTALTGAAKE